LPALLLGTTTSGPTAPALIIASRECEPADHPVRDCVESHGSEHPESAGRRRCHTTGVAAGRSEKQRSCRTLMAEGRGDGKERTSGRDRREQHRDGAEQALGQPPRAIAWTSRVLLGWSTLHGTPRPGVRRDGAFVDAV